MVNNKSSLEKLKKLLLEEKLRKLVKNKKETEVSSKIKETIESLNLKGEKGDKGDKGSDGRDGVDGKDGINGKDGKNGTDGKDGLDGKDGINGKDGIDGLPGKDGSPDSGEQIIEKINLSELFINKERIKGLADIERMAIANAFNPTMGPSFADLKKLQDQINGISPSITLAQNHFLVGDATNTAVDAGANLTWNGTKLSATEVQTGTIRNTSSGTEIDVNGEFLYSGGLVRVNWGGAFLYDQSQISSIDWHTRKLIDSAGKTSVKYDGVRQLIAPDGTTVVMDWTSTTTAINSILPSQTSNSGKYLTTNGTNVSWSAITAGGITLTNAHILVGNVSNVAADVAVSGDLTLANTGAFTVATVGGVTAANIATGVNLALNATSSNIASTIMKRTVGLDVSISSLSNTAGNIIVSIANQRLQDNTGVTALSWSAGLITTASGLSGNTGGTSITLGNGIGSGSGGSITAGNGGASANGGGFTSGNGTVNGNGGQFTAGVGVGSGTHGGDFVGNPGGSGGRYSSFITGATGFFKGGSIQNAAGTVRFNLTNGLIVNGLTTIIDVSVDSDTALNSILPSQTSNSGKFLTTNGSSTSWASALSNTLTQYHLFVGDASNNAVDGGSDFTYDSATGNFNVGSSGNSYLKLDGNNFVFQVGDISSALNSNYLDIDDGNKIWSFRGFGGTNPWMLQDNNSLITTIGDVNVVANGTSLIIDDSTQLYTLNKLGGSGNRMVTTDNSGVLGTSPLPLYNINSSNYGTTVTASGFDHVVFTGGTGASTVDISALAVGDMILISDLDRICATNSITIDAGVGNVIVSNMSNQTYVMSTNGMAVWMQRVTATQFKII